MISALLGATGCERPAASAHPDFAGWWVWNVPVDGTLPSPFIDAPYKPQFADLARQMTAAFREAKLPDLADLGVDQRRTYCEPQRFAGFNGGFEDAVEFLFTPGRVTVTNEEGLIRRIALDAPLPATPYETNAGTSVAHWEGDTLVVETIAVHPRAPFGVASIGRNARIVERISQTGPESLRIDVRIEAPEVLEGAYEKTLSYRLSKDHVFHDGSLSSSSCLIDDPSIDPVTGRQRLDMTPPADLPPPPSE